jgi:hypothetical protein
MTDPLNFGKIPRTGTMQKPVKQTERGWGGHYICASSCNFRRNTLLEAGDTKVVVSTVGAKQHVGEWICPNDYGIDDIGGGRYYETMAFHSDKDDDFYHDADVQRQVDFDSNNAIMDISRESDMAANKMHDAVVAEITARLKTEELT